MKKDIKSLQKKLMVAVIEVLTINNTKLSAKIERVVKKSVRQIAAKSKRKIQIVTNAAVSKAI